jgi:hypothetical protein
MRPCNRQGTGKEVVMRRRQTGSWRGDTAGLTVSEYLCKRHAHSPVKNRQGSLVMVDGRGSMFSCAWALEGVVVWDGLRIYGTYQRTYQPT